MAVSSNATYLPTLDEFLAHWPLVNTALGVPTPLVLKGGITLAAMQQIRALLVSNQADVQTQRNEVQIARNTMNILRGVMLDVLGKFNGLLDSFYGGTIFENTRPRVPGSGVNLLDFSDPMQDARSLWVRVEAAPAPAGLTLPLVLPVAVPAILGQAAVATVNLALFTTLLALLQTAHANIKNAEQSLMLARRTRDVTQVTIYEALKNYRTTVPARLPSTSVLLQTMPKLTAEGSRTPEAVNASAVFVAPDKAKIVFEASLDPDLQAYDLHAVTGDDWSAEDAEVVDTLPAGADPREFLTTFGLTQPGAAATFSVYVRLTTGHIKGSAPMTIVRPG